MPHEMLSALILAIIQGLTEFLPVSSSGHLVIAESLIGARSSGEPEGIIFEVAVHVGTLGAVILVYRTKIREVTAALISFARAGFRSVGNQDADVAYAGKIVIASVPAALAGMIFHGPISGAFGSPALASAMLVATGVFLLFSRFGRVRRTELSCPIALLIGVSQAVAVMPGCSRSGWTITAALLLGLGFERAAEFSFLLSIPAILGALALEMIKNPVPVESGEIILLLVAMVTAFVSGLIALRLLLKVLKGRYLHIFSYYLIPVGLAAVLYFTLMK